MTDEHRAKLERQLLTAYDARYPAAAARRAMWLRQVTAIAAVVALATATQVPAEYQVEVGRRVVAVFPAGVALPEGEVSDEIARAFTAEQSRLVDIGVAVRLRQGGGRTLLVDVWGDRLADPRTAERNLRQTQALAGAEIEVTPLSGAMKDNLLGKLRHALFRRGASAEDREVVRQRVIEELRRREGPNAEVDVQVESVGDKQRVRARVKKRVVKEGDDAAEPEQR